MPKWFNIVAGVIVFLVVLGWVRWHYSPMREIERSRDAVAAIKSWHVHHERHLARLSPDTWDDDFFCPVFQHRTFSSTGPDGTPLVQEAINYSGRMYSHLGDQWTLSGGTQAQIDANAAGTVPIMDCMAGPIGADQSSVSFASMLDGHAERGEYRTVEDGTCRDYHVTVPTPNDPEEKEFQFSICINENDHLPRETRRTLPGASQETVSSFSKWGALHEPPLPPGIPN